MPCSHYRTILSDGVHDRQSWTIAGDRMYVFGMCARRRATYRHLSCNVVDSRKAAVRPANILNMLKNLGDIEIYQIHRIHVGYSLPDHRNKLRGWS